MVMWQATRSWKGFLQDKKDIYSAGRQLKVNSTCTYIHVVIMKRHFFISRQFSLWSYTLRCWTDKRLWSVYYLQSDERLSSSQQGGFLSWSVGHWKERECKTVQISIVLWDFCNKRERANTVIWLYCIILQIEKCVCSVFRTCKRRHVF